MAVTTLQRDEDQILFEVQYGFADVNEAHVALMDCGLDAFEAWNEIDEAINRGIANSIIHGVQPCSTS